MLDFKAPILDDISWIKPILSLYGGPGSEDAFGSLYVWQDAFNTKVLRQGEFLLKLYSNNKEKIYGFPVGKGDLTETVKLLIQDSEQRNIPFVFGGITESKRKFLEENMPGKFRYIEEPDKEDYIYSVDDLVTLKGKKYHSKRNHISKFNRLYKWSYQDISNDNINECKAFIDEWFLKNIESKRSDIILEKAAIDRAFSSYSPIGFEGGIILIDGKICAITIGEKINNEVFDIHFEKAFVEYNGLYSVINNEFAKRKLKDYLYINREEDMGVLGIRKAKLSYHPVAILKRYRAEYIYDN